MNNHNSNRVEQMETEWEVEEVAKKGYIHHDIYLTQSDIEHLKNGGYLIFSDEEYSASIEVKE